MRFLVHLVLMLRPWFAQIKRTGAAGDRIKEGIRAAGGIPMEFPVHPIQETGKRPTAALDRNLAYLGLVEVLHGYPLDGVVLTTG